MVGRLSLLAVLRGSLGVWWSLGLGLPRWLQGEAVIAVMVGIVCCCGGDEFFVLAAIENI